MRRIAEIDLVRMHIHPLRAQAAGHIPTDAVGHDLREQHPRNDADADRGGRHALIRPRRHGQEAQAGAAGKQRQRQRGGDHRARDHCGPGHRRDGRFVRRHAAAVGLAQ
ncbi:hypothetical protein G6F65_019904 [Rhizopus arrhizus]|nr:hypothetical protein G6F24_017315 [Rhizopus arrhizus]KAG1247919.1 hypothetical protein G6F65_019904 [Rhizopus arrhizus]